MMADASDEEDSRTSSVGLSRPQSNGSLSTPRIPSNDSNGRKKAQKNDKTASKDLQDFVPRGGKFSTAPLAVDPQDSDSSSRSDSSKGNGLQQDISKRRKTNAPAINWNQASRGTNIRTTLGARTAPTNTKNEQQTKSAFDAVNDKYFRSRSASASGEEDDENHNDNNHVELKTDEKSKTYFLDDSDDSASGEVSEGGDSMMLNIGQQSNGHGLGGSQDARVDISNPPFILDTSPNLDFVPINVSTSQGEQGEDSSIGENDSILSGLSATELPPQSKAEAFAEFAASYTTSPAILADLKIKDLEIQARFFFYNSTIHELDLTLPISCTECLQEGHLAYVCPSKECENCGSWGLHEGQLCPTIRRCQRCREVGHDSGACSSSLKASASETPCDYCGSDTHTEFDCDKLWKFPRSQPLDGPIKVSISCSYCTNKNHLVGDCPLRKVPTTSSTFSLKDYTPSVITNLNSVVGPRKADEPGMSIRGRAGHVHNAAPPDDDDMLVLHNGRTQPGFRDGRGKINIRAGLGQNRGYHGGPPPPPLPRESPPPFQARDYRNRDGDFHRGRRRSRSPGRGNRPHPSSFQRGPRLGPPPPPPRGRGGRGRGRGRGDQYRPGRS